MTSLEINPGYGVKIEASIVLGVKTPFKHITRLKIQSIQMFTVTFVKLQKLSSLIYAWLFNASPIFCIKYIAGLLHHSSGVGQLE